MAPPPHAGHVSTRIQGVATFNIVGSSRLADGDVRGSNNIEDGTLRRM